MALQERTALAERLAGVVTLGGRGGKNLVEPAHKRHLVFGLADDMHLKLRRGQSQER